MKFLIFNLAVAAALVFLFTADRGDVQKMAGQVHDAAADVKAYAKRTLDKGQKVLDPAPAVREARLEPVQQAAPARTQEKPRPVPTPPAQASRVAEAAPAAPVPPVASRPAAAPLKAAVAQRRQEVLDGIPPGTPVAAIPELKDGTTLMNASDRRKELLSLAEEMELLYARSISR